MFPGYRGATEGVYLKPEHDPQIIYLPFIIFALCEQHHSVTPNCLTEELKMLFYGSLLLFYEHRVCFHYQEKDMRPWVTHGDAVSDLPPDQLFLMLRSHTTNLGYPPPSQFFLVPHLFFSGMWSVHGG